MYEYIFIYITSKPAIHNANNHSNIAVIRYTRNNPTPIITAMIEIHPNTVNTNTFIATEYNTAKN